MTIPNTQSGIAAARVVVVDKAHDLRLQVLIERKAGVGSMLIVVFGDAVENEPATFVATAIVENDASRSLSPEGFPVDDRIRHVIAVGNHHARRTVFFVDVEPFDVEPFDFEFFELSERECARTLKPQRIFDATSARPVSCFPLDVLFRT